jgi:predicted MFS family arabinose efflux permease
MTAELAALRAVLHNPQLRRLHAAWLLTSVGMWGGTLALSLYAFGRGGAAGAGLRAVLRALPGAATAPLLAALTDRVSRRRVMLAASAARAGVMVAIALAVRADAPLGVIYAAVVVLAMAGPAFRPAFVAVVPRFARTPTELTSANVAASAVHNAGFLLGSLGAGVLVAATSAEVALAATGGSFALAALPLLALEHDPPPEAEPGERPFAEIAAGIRTVATDSPLRAVVALAALLFFVDGALDVLVVVAAVELLDAGASGAGILTSAWGVGCVAGGGAVLVLLSRSQLTRGVGLGAAVLGAAIAVVGLVSSLPLAVLALLGFGVGYTLVEVAQATLLQRAAPNHLLGRIAGVTETCKMTALALGSLCAGLAADWFGGRATLIGLGVGAALVALVLAIRVVGLESSTPVDERAYRLLRGHPIFAPLSVAQTERIATALVEVTAPGGDTLITTGEVSDRFYLIADGDLEVFVDGALRRVCGPGDGVGEIGLVRDVPRTATVRARNDTVLLALDRATFLDVVTQGRPERAAHRIADAREPLVVTVPS